MSRLIPVAGDLLDTPPSILLQSPKTKTSGEFNIFEIDMISENANRELKWMSLPNRGFLALAKHPVALFVKNCAQIPALQASIYVKVKPILCFPIHKKRLWLVTK